MYSKLKDLLIKKTAASERKCLPLLFTSEELGDRKPTQLLQHMQLLLGNSAAPNQTTLSSGNYFFNSSPAMLAWCWPSLGIVSPDTLADMADKILEVAPPSVIPHLSSRALDPFASSSPYQLGSGLWSEISELRQLISSLQLSPGHPSCSHSQPRFYSRSHASSPGPSSSLHYSPDQSPVLPSGYRCRGEGYSSLLLWQ